jgi:hypothetical protein
LLNFGYQLISSPDTAQVVLDLYIMAFLAIVWMYQDSKISGKSIWYFLPFASLTLVFVSIGPLLYLVLKSTEVAKKYNKNLKVSQNFTLDISRLKRACGWHS